jgi:23S rRNA (cytosine1962-C5)-methyltransferase
LTRIEPTLHLKPKKDGSLQRRHPWVFAGAVERTSGKPAPGDTVRVVGADGRFLAWAAFSPASSIRARVWTFDEAETVDAAFIAASVQAAVARRESLRAGSDALRLVFGEADALPGCIVDRYGAQLVVQFLSTGVERWREAIVDALVAATGCTAVYERSDASAREREGLALRTGPICGEVPDPVPVTEHGVRYRVDVVAGHKTGFYIDQRDSRALVREHAAGRRVLNCFCYTGGFTLAARHGGATEAISIDASAEALAMAAANERDNGFETPSTWLQANVFDALKTLLAEGRRFDLIVLDPPKFAASASQVEGASRGYKDINLLAFKLLRPGGTLFTFSCSGHIMPPLFQKIVADAALDAGRNAAVIRFLGQSPDHPVALNFPEAHYLKGLICRVE